MGGVGGKLNRCGLEWGGREPECRGGAVDPPWGVLPENGEHQADPWAGWGTIGGFAPSEIHGCKGVWKWGRHICPLGIRAAKRQNNSQLV